VEPRLYQIRKRNTVERPSIENGETITMDNKFIIVVGYEHSQLVKRVNLKMAEGFKPVLPHTVYLKDPENELYEYAVSMLYDPDAEQ